MPTKTLFNLPENKREKLLEAIHAEFSRVIFNLQRHDDVRMQYLARMELFKRGFIKCSDI